MKKIFTLVVLVLGIMTTTLTSCDNEILNSEQLVQHNEDSSLKTTALAATSTTLYGTSPTSGNYSGNSSPSVTLSGACGNYLGGVIKAQVFPATSTSYNNSFIIRIWKQDNSLFSAGGVAKVRAGSVCGGEAGYTFYFMSNQYVDVTINATFTKGITHFYPVVESSAGGNKYYAEPILIYTLPTYTMSSVDGTVIGTVNGVEVKSSGIGSSNLVNINSNSDNQCTEFCNRYYRQVYSMDIINPGTTQGGHAKFWYGTASAKGLIAYANNSSNIPRVGDILCMNNNPVDPQKNGHVAIITEVSSTQVKIAHQNGGVNWFPIGGVINRTSTGLTVPGNGYKVQGWLRKP